MTFQIQRLPETDDELYLYTKLRFGVAIPRTPVCPDHVPPFRAFADAYFARNTIDPTSPITSIGLWWGSRGLSGKSFALSLLAILQAELLGSDVNLLGGSYAQSMNIQEHVGQALDYENAPTYMIAQRAVSKITYTNGARIRPLTASQKTVRGPHPARLECDEIDEMDIRILDAALGQPLPQRNYLGQTIRPYTTLCSTWQHPLGTFREIKRRAEETGIPVYKWCFLESANPVDGWLAPSAIEEKRASIPKAMWESEYILNEPSIGNRAFDPEAIERTFSLQHTPNPTPLAGEDPGGYIRGKEAKDFEEFVYEAPVRGADYIAAADWGKDVDYTVISVGRVDVFPFRLVYWMKVNRRPYPQMVGFFNKAINRYGAKAIHDSTGVGNAVDDYVDLRAQGFTMTGEKRSAMLTEYVSAIESDQWRYPKIPSAFIALKYTRTGDLYSGRTQEFHLPDEVCSLALLHHLARNRTPLVGPPDMTRGNDEQTALQRQLDPPPIARRVGDVVRKGEDDLQYSLG